MNIKDLLGKKIIILDGAMGTMIQKRGLKLGELPELLNITNPEIIESIHKEYIQAGCDVVTTNTFGANSLKLKESGYSTETLVSAAVKIARKAAKNKFVALDIGPSGKMMEPTGDLTFDAAYDLYQEQVIAGTKAGADLILFETFSDIYEMKAAVLAAKENSHLPVFCSITFQEDERTLMGTDPFSMVNILQDMGIDALGVNCSLGPHQMVSVVKQIMKYSRIPVLVQPNAGLPEVVEGETVFQVDIDAYIEAINEMVDEGVQIVGGCCGTTPEYIRRLKETFKDKKPKVMNAKPFTALSSPTNTVMLDERICIIGERINPTGKKQLKEALREDKISFIVDEAILQADSGAHILDINVGLPEIDEKEMMCKAIRHIQQSINLPLQIDSSDPEVIEQAVRYYNGKPIINSVNGKKSVMDEIFPIVKKYGTCVVALTLDEKGLPESCEERVDIADKIIRYAQDFGINKERIIVDCLTLTVSAQQDAAYDTLRAMKIIKERYGVKTTLGASNISFGLPERKILNRTFLAAALTYGLDAPITDPTEKETMDVIKAFEVLSGKDREAKDYIEYFSKEESEPTHNIKKETKESLDQIIIKGLIDKSQPETLELLKTKAPLEIVNQVLLPALEVVGHQYETGEIFLPQLIKSAETVKKAFEVIKEKLKENGDSLYCGKIILATVKGDIHDIGKNIVKVLLENYGYEIIDLGKDVSIEEVVNTAKNSAIELVGLSALMTTTVISMEKTIQALKDEGLTCKVMVGGAVLNPEYATKIGADYYCKDGMAAVRVAKEVFEKER